MIPVTRPFVSATCCVLALCTASAAARADELTAEATPSASPDPLDGIGEPVASPEPEAETSAAESGFAPLAGGVGAAVGVGAGAVVGIGGSYLIQALIVGAPTSGLLAGVAVLASSVAPLMFFGLPVLGAGFGAFVALAAVTDAPIAAIGGVAAAVATPLGAVAGAVSGVVVGLAAGTAMYSNADPLFVIALGLGGGVIGAGLGAIAGAATGGAVAGFVVESVE